MWRDRLIAWLAGYALLYAAICAASHGRSTVLFRNVFAVPQQDAPLNVGARSRPILPRTINEARRKGKGSRHVAGRLSRRRNHNGKGFSFAT
jgi:hypothetical protein